MKITKLFSTLLLVSISTLLISFVIKKDVKAVQIDQDEYNVTIDINKDSTYTVTEELKNDINGTFHGLRRDIPLDSPDSCVYSDSTCGGFDLIIPLGIYDENGKERKSGTRIYEYSDASGRRYQRYEWEFYHDGKDVTNKKITWTVKYKIVGGIAWVKNNSNNVVPFFYWNVFARDDEQIVRKATLRINFPSNMTPEENRLLVYSPFIKNSLISSGSNYISLVITNMTGYGAYTVSYEFKDTDLIEPGILDYKITSPVVSNKVYWGDVKISTKNEDTFYLFPSGEQEINFKHFGYKTQTKKVTIKPGERTSLEVALKPTAFMAFILSLEKAIEVVGVVLIPFAIYQVYRRYETKGKDINRPKTVIPLFSPPEGVQPYLLGTLKDEYVDKEDTTGTIIDLAYRGFIKIKEIDKGKNYQLTKLEGKKGESLNPIETDLMTAFFGSSDQIETKDLTYSFVTKFQLIESKIYDELVSKGYFTKSPKKVRELNFSIGCASVILGIFASIFISLVLTQILGISAFFTPGIALIAFGIGTTLVAKYMPAKTELGSKTFNQILGFRMYMYTAERFRVQNLTPETFEKYLSYAIVFKIEKQWAEKFKDIYKGMPEWYEGSGNFTNAIYFSSFARSFSTATESQIRTLTTAHNSSRGGGWSGGGGSFGGFSGGGGGGGSAGGW